MPPLYCPRRAGEGGSGGGVSHRCEDIIPESCPTCLLECQTQLKEARAKVKQLRTVKDPHDHLPTIVKVCRERDQARAELETLRRVADRARDMCKPSLVDSNGVAKSEAFHLRDQLAAALEALDRRSG